VSLSDELALLEAKRRYEKAREATTRHEAYEGRSLKVGGGAIYREEAEAARAYIARLEAR